MGAWVTIVDGAGEGESLEITTGGVTVGRGEDADLVLADAGASRRHARIELDPGGVPAISDLGSSNGTFVNAEPVSGTRALADGDEITIGGTRLELRGGPEAATEVLGAGAAATERVAPPPPARRVPPEQPEPALAPRPAPPRQPAAGRTDPARRSAMNWAALVAIVLGPLSILLVLLGSGAALYASLPVAVAGVAFGSAGKRRADERGSGMRSPALAGQIFAVVGVVLSVLVIALLVIFNQIVDAGADSLEGLIDEVRSEIEGIPLPEDLEG